MWCKYLSFDGPSIKGAHCDSSSQFNESCEKIEEWMLIQKQKKQKKLKDSWDEEEEEDPSIRRLKKLHKFMEKEGHHALCQLHKRDDHSYRVIFREIFVSSDLFASCHMFKCVESCQLIMTLY